MNGAGFALLLLNLTRIILTVGIPLDAETVNLVLKVSPCFLVCVFALVYSLHVFSCYGPLLFVAI